MSIVVDARRTAADGRRLLGCVAERAVVAAAQRLGDANRLARMDPVREHCPVLKLGSTAVVTRRDDVVALLDDPEQFAAAYYPRLPPRFALGLEGSAHRRNKNEIAAVLRDDDLPRIQSRTTSIAHDSFRRAWSSGSIDVGADLVHPVFDDVLESYLGVPSPGPQTLWRWGEDLFQHIFVNVRDFSVIRRQADIATAQMTAYVNSLIDERRRTHADRDDVLGRLLARAAAHPETSLGDDEICFTVIGLAIGWLWHGARTALLAVDELLDRPDALAAARSAAVADDLDRLRRVLWEALRFRPIQLGLLRTCPSDAVAAPGSDAATRISAGSLVVVGTHSAMWDEHFVYRPEQFDADRPDAVYFHFGHGIHRCAGERLMGLQLPAMLAPLLTATELRRHRGRAGRLRRIAGRPDGLLLDVR
jgi:cytochrome P450